MKQDQNAQIKAMIDKAFAQKAAPACKSLHYRWGMFISAVGILLLPLLYCLLIGAIVYGMVEYNQWVHDFFQSRAPLDLRNWQPGQEPQRVNLDNEIWVADHRYLFLYIPLVITATIVVFLLRPFLPRFRHRQAPLYEITSQSEPTVYHLIERISMFLGVSVPRHIELTIEPKVTAAYRWGIFSLLGGGLTLRIGLPVISGLTVSQLVGLLTHELGHFRQGVGMRLSYLMSCVLDWFSRNIYDEKLDEDMDMDAGESFYGRISRRQRYVVFMILISLFVLLTRGVLWLFLAAGSLIGRSLTRQMEYDADLGQIQAAGSHDFESVIYVLHTLDMAYREAFRTNEKSRDSGVVVNDLPALIKNLAADRLNKFKKEIVEVLLEAETESLDAYPCPRDRIAQARRENLAGMCRIDVKSKMLFKDYPLLCRQLTGEFFEREFKPSRVEIRSLSVEGFEEYMLDTKLRRRR